MNLKSVKARLKDDTLDLSLCDLKEVPVREIAPLKKAVNLDLSNNALVSLPSTFVSLKQIVKLDLSRNMLTEIPENFGELRQLRYLDLYANQISRLPLSLSELKNLKWLDLKENPLTPAVASIAGPCSNLSECQACARNVVTYLSSVKLSIEEEKLRRLNAATTAAESDNALPKKAGKKKKKKVTDKDGKENSNKDASTSSSEKSGTERNVEEISAGIEDLNVDEEHRYSKGKFSIVRFFLTSLIVGILLIVILRSMYTEQSIAFVNYLEEKTGLPLKDYEKQSIEMLHFCIGTVTTWTRGIVKDLYQKYESKFREDVADLPSK